MNSLVSIIIPTYNHAKYLYKALKSVVGQSYKNWEAIVVDNYSDDNTELIVKSFNDSRIKFLKIHNNGIIAASRNLGIKSSRGRWLSFLDADDWWYSKKLEKCIVELNKGAQIVCHAENWIKNNQVIRTVKYGPKDKADYHNLLYRKNCFSTSAFIVERDCVLNVGGFTENILAVGVEDYHLWLKLAKEEYKSSFIDEVLGCYRIYNLNYSANIYRQLKS